jgi:predicted acylesterase/phospholipase RssA
VGRLWRWLARGAWYDAAPLKELLGGFLLADQRRLNEDSWTTGTGRPRLTVRPFAVISCLFHNSSPRVHANYGDAHQRSNETLMSVLRATSAAPAFFPPEVINKETHVDGGVGNNNPSLLCFEVRYSIPYHVASYCCAP